MKLRWLVLVIGLVLAPLFSVFPVASSAVTSSPCAGAAAVDHQDEILVGETPEIAALLAPVKGSCYVDVSDEEAQAVVDGLQAMNDENDEFIFSAVSLHSVVSQRAADNTARGSTGAELGFLKLISFGPEFAPPAGLDEDLATTTVGGDVIDRFTVDGTKVFVIRDATAGRDSRYHFTWVRHGVQADLDGASRAPMEKWVRKYLAQPVLVGSETSVLTKALVPVTGYVYANFAADELAQVYVTDPLGDVPFSVHQVIDAEHSIGGVVLAEVPTSVSTADYAAALQQGALQGATAGGTTDIAGMPVARFTTTDGEVFVWARNGIAGVGMTALVEHFDPFLQQFLAAQA